MNGPSAQNRAHGISWRGRFEIKLDPKGRLSLPSVYRENLPAVARGAAPELVVTNSRYKNQSCLDAYLLADWEKLERRISKLSALKPSVQAFNRFYMSGGQTLEVDAQSRILVPQSLRRYAGLESDVVLIGLGGKFEIWSQAAWSSVHQSLAENFEDTISAVASLELKGEDEE